MPETKETYPLVSFAFSVSGNDFNPVELTQLLSLEPLEIWRKTHDTPEFAHILSTSWFFGVEDSPSYSISEVAEPVLTKLWPKRDLIVSYVEKNINLVMQFSYDIKIFEDRPEYTLTPSVLNKMAYFNADLTFDICDYSN